MNCAAFKRLSSKRQRQVVLDLGVPLGKRESRNFCIYLFAVDAFYVEVYFFKESEEYGTVKPLSEVEGLDPYLNDIQLDDLLAVLR